MKRRSLKLIVLMLAGAFINFILACSLLLVISPIPVEDGMILPTQDADEFWRVNAPKTWKMGEGDFAWRNRIVGGEQIWVGTGFQFMIDARSPRSFANGFRYVRSSTVGWPFQSVEQVTHNVNVFGNPVQTRYSVRGFGMFANSATFAVACWLAILIPLQFRSFARRRRGQCASCAYSLRENVSDKCPECGANK